MAKYVVCADEALIGNNLEKIENAAIVVAEDKIADVGTQDELIKKYPKAELLMLGKVCLMPGMIDSHTHTSMDARVPGHLDRMNDPAPELTVRAVNYVKDDLMSGITTARVLGDKEYVDVTVRNAIREGGLTGPRLVVAGIGMRSIHGHGFVGVPHTGVQEFRHTARENMLHRTEWLKVFITAGAPPVNGTHIPSFLSYEEIETVCGEAKRMGIRTSAHCIGGQGLRDAVKAGIDVIDHAYCATIEDLELIKEKERWICLTPSVFMSKERNLNNPPATQKNTDIVRKKVTAVMQKIVTSGVKYAIGSDALHASMALEAECAVKLGAAPKEAVMGITVHGAELCGVERITGSLTLGFSADMIAVKGNPVEDISALNEVSFIMKEGIIYKK
ncbi:MAG: amidohydrolase family protein [Lachnospiraceae bacterium]|nr:amidohydrolase family protein [Lachnospiraceae bacterium]